MIKLRLPRSSLALAFTLTVLSVMPSRAEASQADFESKISQADFQALLVEKAPLVDAFREVWNRDRDASIVYGAIRNYAFWMKRKITEGSVDDVRKLTRIESEEFLPQGSDLDVLLSRPIPSKKKKKKQANVWNKIPRILPHISRVESVHSTRFEPGSTFYQTDVSQGWLPSEKLRLSREGFITDPTFGDGLGEIYSGRVSIVFSSDEDFASNHYVKKFLNHRILLVARYMRNISMSYAALSGQDPKRPIDRALLLSLVPENVKERIHAIIQPMLTGPTGSDDAFRPYLDQTSFVRWLNHSLERAYLGPVHTNATAFLHQYFGLSSLVARYPELGPLPSHCNQYLNP